MKNEITKQYLQQGKNLMPLNGKRPIKQNWTELKLSADEILSHNGNKGWILGASDLIIDVDKQNGGLESYAQLVTDLGLDLEPTVNTPSGGFHVYLSIPNGWQGKSFHKTLNAKYEGIDFLTKGSQAVIVGSSTDKGDYEWADDLFGGFVQLPAPDALLLEISYDNERVTDINSDDLGDFTGMFGGKSAHWSEDDVLAMLDKLDPSMPNGEWVKVGQGLHDWSPIEGLEFWENWSKGGDNYTEGETAKRWKSFKLGGGVTLGTLSYMAKKVTYEETHERVNEYIKQIADSNEKQLEFELMPQISKEIMSRINKEKIVKAIQDRYSTLTGVKMPIGSLRQAITNQQVIVGEVVDESAKPNWCKHWVYVNTHAGFMSSETYTLHKSESFNVENGRYVPMGDSGTKPSASKYVSDGGHVDKVDAMAYLPMINDFICTIDGMRVANSFNPASVPIEALEHTNAGLEAIERIKKHIKFICTTDENAYIFTQWLAHQVQYTGRQILWSPVVQAIQGVGKSFFGELLRACLGDRNVGTVSPTQVTSDFNGWATNVVVNVLEELRVRGHNRFEAVNALKPLITDRMIQINDKGVKQYMTYNTTNYMCFTNYKDSLPLDIDDRRWWVLFVQIESLDDLHLFVGESAVTYFPKLFDAVRKHGAEIRKWLMDYEISAEFMSIKQAPMTDDKLSMIATEDDSFEGLYEVKDIIETGGKYWNKECLCANDLFNQVAFIHPELSIDTKTRNIMLKKLGYGLMPRVIKIDGKTRRWWSKRPMTNDQVRDSLKKYDSGDSETVEDYFQISE